MYILWLKSCTEFTSLRVRKNGQRANGFLLPVFPYLKRRKSRAWRDSRLANQDSGVSIHATCSNLICCKTGLNVGCKTCNKRYSTHFVSNVAKHQCCAFYRSLTCAGTRKGGRGAMTLGTIAFMLTNT